MADYAGREDVEHIFGKSNVEKWADLNNEEDPIEVAERVAWALNLAESAVNSRLRQGPYSIPFDATSSSGSGDNGVPLEITDTTARQAGIYLYDGRRISDDPDDDSDELSIHRRTVDRTIKGILGGLIVLDATRQAVDYPRAI